MADRAIDRERGLDVVRIGGRVVVRHVAQIAGATRKVVVAIYVALAALQVRVTIGQWESGCSVIEGGLQPRHGVVAGLAGRREVRLNVIRIVRAVVIRHMAQIAGAAGQVVVVVHMALRTLQVRVTIRQRETH